LAGLTGGLVGKGAKDVVSALIVSTPLDVASTALIAKASIDIAARNTNKEAKDNIHVFRINMESGDFLQKGD
jgi:hypothetical protein